MAVSEQKKIDGLKNRDKRGVAFSLLNLLHENFWFPLDLDTPLFCCGRPGRGPGAGGD